MSVCVCVTTLLAKQTDRQTLKSSGGSCRSMDISNGMRCKVLMNETAKLEKCEVLQVMDKLSTLSIV